DTTALSSAILAFYGREVFCSYLDTHGARRRVVYHTKKNTFRNDDRDATAMMYEQDSGFLVYGDSNGMIWQDRIGDSDDGGYVTGTPVILPMDLDLQFPFFDEGLPKNEKVYNELTLDIDTAGHPVNVELFT